MTRALVAAGVIATFAAAAPVLAQGKSQAHQKNPPPSRSDLTPSSTPVTTTIGGATPFAWVDDASLLETGAVSITIFGVRWQGTDVSEVDLPVVDATVGMAPRVQLAMTVPRVVGSADPAGAAGGVGTSYFSAKIALVDDRARSVKLSVAPTLEVLGRGVLQSLTPGARRAHFGLPVSAEVNRGPLHLYGGAGYFSRGVWFAGGGVGGHAARKVYVSSGYSRSWRRSEGLSIPISDRDRNEISGSASYALAPHVNVYAALARTVATLEENGAGTTISGGASFFFARAAPRPAGGTPRKP
jgi:hypothetical protein